MVSVSVMGSTIFLPDFGASCQMVSALISSCDLPTALLPDLAVKATGLGLRNLVEGAKVFMLNAILSKFVGRAVLRLFGVASGGLRIEVTIGGFLLNSARINIQ